MRQSLAVVVLLIAVVTASTLEQTPVFAYSGSQVLEGKDVQVRRSVKLQEVASELRTMIKENSARAVVVFIVPELSSSMITQHAEVFTPNSNGGLFSFLKSSVQNSPSSVTYSHVVMSGVPAYVMLDSARTIKGAKVVHVVEGTTVDGALSMPEFMEGLRNEEFNGKSTVYVVELTGHADAKTLARAVDAALSEVTKLVQAKTQEYVMVVMSNGATLSMHADKMIGRQMLQTAPVVNSTNGNVVYVIWTPVIWMGLLAILLLTFLLSMVLCCLCTIQPLETFEKPSKRE